MKRIFAFAIIGLLIWSSLAFASDDQSENQWTIIHAGTLLAIPGKAPRNEQSLIIHNGQIVEVKDGYANAGAVKAEDAAVKIVDLSHGFVMPGLMDLHVHLSDQFSPKTKMHEVTWSDADYAINMAHNAWLTLQAGFTTVRDLASSGDAIFAVRDGIANGKIPGPRIFAAGHMISATGGHGDVHGFRSDVMAVLNEHNTCSGADDCRRAVRAEIKRGADLIKIAATGGVLSDTNSGTGQQLTDEELKAIVETAHSLNRQVTAHAHGVGGINAALRAGVDSIEHGTYSDAESIKLYKHHKAYLIPTLLAGATVNEMAEKANFMPPAIREKAMIVGRHHIEVVRAAHKAGVEIGFGTDSGVSAHGDNAKEFPLLVKAGLTPMEALQTSTVVDAKIIRMSDRLGTLESGKIADVIAVSGNPLDDITIMQKVVFVMKAGQIYKQP